MPHRGWDGCASARVYNDEQDVERFVEVFRKVAM